MVAVVIAVVVGVVVAVSFYDIVVVVLDASPHLSRRVRPSNGRSVGPSAPRL